MKRVEFTILCQKNAEGKFCAILAEMPFRDTKGFGKTPEEAKEKLMRNMDRFFKKSAKNFHEFLEHTGQKAQKELIVFE